MEAAILLLPALFKEDSGLLFKVEVSHEQLTTVCGAQSNQSTALIAHFVVQMISMQTLGLVFCLLVYTNYAIKVQRKLHSFSVNGQKYLSSCMTGVNINYKTDSSGP